MIERIHVRGRFEATRIDVPYRLLVISITDSEADLAQFKCYAVADDKDVLRLCFHDIDPTSHEYDFESMYEDEITARRNRPMNPFHAKQIMPFLKSRLRDGVSVLLVHCEAGISRSISTAMALCDGLGLDRSIIDWKHDVHRDAPNRHVYDTVLATIN
jgi:predicted protein tyrosine phosphatase